MSATCPYCRTAFEEDDEVVACTACATEHHPDCLQENGGCTVFGCSCAPADEAKISISSHDLVPPGTQPASPGGHSLFNLFAPAAAIQTADSIAVPAQPLPPPLPTPPPPRVPGSVAPPPPGALHTTHTPVMTYPTFGGYAAPPPEINSYTPRKSRIVFVLLAVFLGAFGGHNFYAGYVKKGVVQLCITIFSCFFGSPVSWIWAIVEACMVNRDDDGIAFV